jgi:hypothetical protein
MGLFSIFLLGMGLVASRLAGRVFVALVRLRPVGFGATALARFTLSLWHWLAEPKLAKAGGPGRTRTCNETVMSGGTSSSFVDFPAFLFAFDRVCCALSRLFLVRNWCGG